MLMSPLVAVLLLGLVSVASLASGETIDLGGLSWTLSGEDSDGREVSVPASVPGDVYSDLSEAGVLAGALLYRFNDVEYRWVARGNWTYDVVFALSQEQVERTSLLLDCHGLDTVASVYINNVIVGTSDNMFVRHIWDVKSLVTPGNNSLRVSFQSPVEFARRRAGEVTSELGYSVPPACVPEEYSGECHANHIRKMQASFSWDWGPAFPTSGIWLPIQLVAGDWPRVEHITWSLRDTDTEFFTATVSAMLEGPECVDCLLIYHLDLGSGFSGPMSRVSGDKWTAEIRVQKKYVELWWPNGYGEQKLYDLSVVIEDNQLNEVDNKHHRKVGFRTVELVQEPLSKGLSFYFKVNGQAIFMKGSNWIPANVLGKYDEDYYLNLLWSAKEAHMNMLRVWGGGIYEYGQFYKLADELGILIWQDFMFACAMYPATNTTLESVRDEVRSQVRRLQFHASIALWAGNNENEAALRGNWYGTDYRFESYKADYIKLYVDTIKEVVSEEDPDRDFLVSSPGNGLASEQEGYIASDPYSSLYGDTHYYNYKEDNWDHSIYPRTRFASEYGFQSWPAWEVIEPVSEVWDWSLSSAWMAHRQHHPGGNMELLWQIGLNMDIDQDALDNVAGLQDFLYKSQVYQAVSLKTETETYRRGMVEADPDTGEGMTMGALYWQLNDIWQGASWSSLEYGGQWKLSHYFAESFFRPVIISPIIDKDMVQVWLVCDEQMPDTEMLLIMDVYHYDRSVTMTTRVSAFCNAGGSVKIMETSLSSILEEARCRTGSYDSYRLQYCLLYFTLRDSGDGHLFHSNHIMAPPKTLSTLPTANIDLMVTGRSNELVTGPYVEVYSLSLLSDNIALFVTLSSGECRGRFSDNGFLVTGAVTHIEFLSKEFISVEQLQNCVSLRHYKR